MRQLILTLLLFALAGSMRADVRGAWTATAADESLSISLWQNDWQSGRTIPLHAFAGLAEGQISAVSETAVHFTLTREAGTLRFEGSFKLREGAGHFTFAPNAAYLEALRKLGLNPADMQTHDGSDDERLFRLAVNDVSSDYIRAIQQAGYHESLEEIMRMRRSDVTPAVIAELRDAMQSPLQAEEVVRLVRKGVTPAFIRQMRSVGFASLEPEDLVYLHRNGITPADAKAALQAAAHPLSPREVARLLRYRNR